MALTTPPCKQNMTKRNAFLVFLSKAESCKSPGIPENELTIIALTIVIQSKRCIALDIIQELKATGRDKIMTAGFMAIIMHREPIYIYNKSVASAW